MMQRLKLAIQKWLLEPEYHIWGPWTINTLQNFHSAKDNEFLWTRIYQDRKCKLCGKTEVTHEDSKRTRT